MNLYPSKQFEKTVTELAKLPGIGNKTATRLALHLLKQDFPEVEKLGNSIIDLRKNIVYCQVCQNISDHDTCEICSNPHRDKTIVCVVENAKDVMAIENTGQYRGIYHVLGGIISPIDGIGPSDLSIGELIDRVSSGGVKEIILALSTTIEGDTTNFFIFRKLQGTGVLLTTLARGIAFGDEIEYADEITLARSIMNRTPYEAMTNLKKQ